jgi:tRNA-splicing ligase RtcB (3'-phosphate/5'-hydroxy nucleic acid ligase)
MKPKRLVELGVPQDCINAAIEVLRDPAYADRAIKPERIIGEVVADPLSYIESPVRGDFARAILSSQKKLLDEAEFHAKNPYGKPDSFPQWGSGFEETALDQMRLACEVPVAVAGAIMPDAHLGYGLPVGGVLATYNSVIPFGVGVDIACRMKLTVLDTEPKRLDDVFSPKVDTFIRALTGGTVFGMGGACKLKHDHPVMDMDWSVSPTTKTMKDRAWQQLGTSGSGNHFVEFGILSLEQPDLGLEAGTYVALLSHSGSRGTGANVCKTYDDIAKSRLPASLEKFKNLAWLSLESEAGQEYWNAMNLMGEYASANHAIIHRAVSDLLGAKCIATVENHHNYAWKEVHSGRELVVHRKGATPAGEGVLGVIPGSMATPAYVVRGKGKPESLMSASHGAGRLMSRTKARDKFNWSDWKSIIKQRGVRLLSAGLDEVPGCYKDIHAVMAAQTDLVDVVGRFDPKIVRMSDDGKAED